jgi:transposase
MNKLKNQILGERAGKSVYFTDEEKRIIIQDYLSGNESKKAVFKRYTGHDEEHGTLLRWMHKYGFEDKCSNMNNFVIMSSNNKKEIESTDFETLKLKKRIEELEKQLQTAEMKAVAFLTMVDIAEKEFNIPIRKKHNTKL